MLVGGLSKVMVDSFCGLGASSSILRTGAAAATAGASAFSFLADKGSRKLFMVVPLVKVRL